MSFSSPQALFLLLLIIPLTFLFIINFRVKKRLLNNFISSTAASKNVVRGGREIDFFKAGLIILAIIMFIFALAGPQWGEKLTTVNIKGLQAIFLLDTSNSMNAEDLKPNRLEVAKSLISSIVESLKTDYVGLINFAAVAYVQCPLTIDYQAFKLLTDASMISPSEEQGTDFSEAFKVALRSFKHSSQSQRTFILITDGEDQEGKWQGFIDPIKEQKIIVFTVGIGIPSGAPIPIKDGSGKIVNWKKDKKGNLIRTVLDEQILIKIASATGGQYFRLSGSSGIDQFVKILRDFERKVIAKKIKSQKIHRFQYPLIIGIILLTLEMVLSERRIRWKRS